MATVVPQIIPAGVVTQEFRTPETVRRGIIAGVVGNMLEWYDFALFGFFAQQLGAHFFPSGNPTVSLLAAFGTFAAGYVARPIGGIVFGHFGDRLGRKKMLLLTMGLMGGASFLIGLLPTYDTIGVWAPVLLITLRVVQGIAIGGEWGGATLIAMG
mgnify:CR=1 FL=1